MINIGTAGNDHDFFGRHVGQIPLQNLAFSGIGQAHNGIATRHKDFFLAFEKVIYKSVYQFFSIPNIAVGPLVGIKAAHIEHEFATQTALHCQPHKSRNVTAAMHNAEVFLPREFECHPLDCQNVEQSRDYRRVFGV